MAQIAPPVQEALSALERLQADAYQRGWRDAMNAVSEFIAGKREADTGQGSDQHASKPEAQPSSRRAGPRGPNRNSLPSRMLAHMKRHQVDDANLSHEATVFAPHDTLVNVRRALNRLMSRGLVKKVGSRYVLTGTADLDLGDAEAPERPEPSEHSGSSTDAEGDREHDAAA